MTKLVAMRQRCQVGKGMCIAYVKHRTGKQSRAQGCIASHWYLMSRATQLVVMRQRCQVGKGMCIAYLKHRTGKQSRAQGCIASHWYLMSRAEQSNTTCCYEAALPSWQRHVHCLFEAQNRKTKQSTGLHGAPGLLCVYGVLACMASSRRARPLVPDITPTGLSQHTDLILHQNPLDMLPKNMPKCATHHEHGKERLRPLVQYNTFTPVGRANICTLAARAAILVAIGFLKGARDDAAGARDAAMHIHEIGADDVECAI
eukprot:1161976-Pelagomonas_calceolata.AAC.8